MNPVLREGNSDRRAPKSVKEYARKHPHSMGAWARTRRPRVHHEGGDFRVEREVRHGAAATDVRIEFVGQDGRSRCEGEAPAAGRRGHRRDGDEQEGAARVLEEQIEDAKKQGVLFSLHLKATMMKVSDPNIFGHAVKVYFKDVFEKHGATFKKLAST